MAGFYEVRGNSSPIPLSSPTPDSASGAARSATPRQKAAAEKATSGFKAPPSGSSENLRVNDTIQRAFHSDNALVPHSRPPQRHRTNHNPLLQGNRSAEEKTSDACERGFSKSMYDMWRVQEDLVQSVDILRKDVEHCLDPDRLAQNAVFAEILSSLHQIQTSSSKHLDFDGAALSKVLSTSLEGLNGLEERLNQKISEVLGEVQAVRKQQEKAEETSLAVIREEVKHMKFGADVTDIVRHLQIQLGEVFNMTQSLNAYSTKTIAGVEELQGYTKSFSTQTIEDVKNLQIETQKRHAEFGPSLEIFLVKYLQETPVNVDLSTVLSQISRTRGALDSDFDQLLNEIAKIQKALNVDFARVIEDMEEMAENVRSSVHHSAVEGGDHRKTRRTNTMDAKEIKKMARKQVRVRDYWAQTDIKEFTSTWIQTDDHMWKAACRPHKHKPRIKDSVRGQGDHSLNLAQVPQQSTKPKAKVFGDAQAMKQQVRRALIQPQYNVTDYYKTTGIFQRLARSPLFEHITLVVIFLNAIWIGIDTDHNDAALLVNARVAFQVAENIFCTFFFTEIMIRFLAFSYKRHCLHDHWFMFDATLVLLMVTETWIITVIMLSLGGEAGGDAENSMKKFGGEASIFRMARLVKLIRISRMARLLRAIPEVVILIKTIGVAARCVLVFLILWIVIIFVFGVIFRQITDGNDIGMEYFKSVPDAMNTLLLNGLFPENEPLVNSIAGAHPLLWILIMCFIMIVSLTLMHMLLAVLVEIIGVISVAEKEGMTVSHVSSQFRHVLENLELSMPLSKLEFQKLLVEPAVTSILQHEGVDVMALVDMIDLIYQDLDVDGAGGLTFEKLVDIILNTRGTNTATVKDVKELLKIMKTFVRESMAHVLEEVTMDFSVVKAELKEMKETQIRALEDQGEESEEEFDMDSPGASERPKRSSRDSGQGPMEVPHLLAVPGGLDVDLDSSDGESSVRS